MLGELTPTGAPPPMMHALRVLLGSKQELERDLKLLATAGSLETEERVWAALRGYCKMARAAMGGPRKADLDAAGAGDGGGVVAVAIAADVAGGRDAAIHLI